jgi:hypothetical protein
MARRVRASYIAPAAESWLEKARAPRVLQVFDGALNLIDKSAGVLSVVSLAIGPGPFSVVLEPDLASANLLRIASMVNLDDTISYSPRDLDIGLLHVDVTGATRWQPKPAWQKARRANWGWLMPWLDEVMSLEASGLPGSSLGDAAFLDRAREGLFFLHEGLSRRSTELCKRAAASLAGLGPGLTPSGDDFLVGAIHAIWATWSGPRALTFSTAMAREAVGRTGALSGAWLSAAARGEAAAPWHTFLEAAARGSLSESAAAAAKLLCTGETSGCDAMSGFVAALAAVAR